MQLCRTFVARMTFLVRMPRGCASFLSRDAGYAIALYIKPRFAGSRLKKCWLEELRTSSACDFDREFVLYAERLRYNTVLQLWRYTIWRLQRPWRIFPFQIWTEAVMSENRELDQFVSADSYEPAPVQYGKVSHTLPQEEKRPLPYPETVPSALPPQNVLSTYAPAPQSFDSRERSNSNIVSLCS